jgi:hypothetical protein
MQRNIMRLLSLAVQIKISDGLMPFKKSKLIPNLKNKIIRRRAADSTDSTARRGNEVRLFFWIGMKRWVYQPNLRRYSA